MVHVGVDLDKRSSQIAVLTDDAEIVQQRLVGKRLLSARRMSRPVCA